jgi:hypothetical protein
MVVFAIGIEHAFDVAIEGLQAFPFRLRIEASCSADTLNLCRDFSGTIIQSGSTEISPIITLASLDDVIDGRKRQRLSDKASVLHLPDSPPTLA